MTLIPAAVVVPEGDQFGRVYQTCKNAMNTLSQFFEGAGVELPDLRFVSNGGVAYDAPLLAVEVVRLRPGLPGLPAAEAVLAHTQYSIETELHLLRDVPTLNDEGEAPTNEAIEMSAMELLRDWWLVFQCILEGVRHGADGDPGDLQGAPFRGAMIQEIGAYGPDGGLGGLVAQLVLQLV